MSAVEVDICNSTLIKLGAMPIADLNEDSKEAKLCRLQYPKIRDSVLRSAPWSFAVKRASLDPIVYTDVFSEADENVFSLPVDCVRVWKINDGFPQDRYRIEGNLLKTSLPKVNIFFVSNATPVAHYDANFKEAVACMLAADLAYALTQSVSIKQGLEQTAEYWISQARSHNSQEVTPEDFLFDDFLDSRRGGYAFYP